MARSNILDLIKRIASAQSNSTVREGSGITLNPRGIPGTRPRVVTQQDRADAIVDSLIGGATRPRRVGPEPSEQEKLADEAAWLRSREDAGRGGSVIAKPSRGRSALLLALQSVGAAAQRNVERGRTDWSDLAGVAGAGAGGAAVGAANPGILVQQKHAQAVAENLEDQTRDIALRKANADIASTEANTEFKRHLPEKYAEDRRLREADISRKTLYQKEALALRTEREANRITEAEENRQLKRLQYQLDVDEFGERVKHNREMESQGRARVAAGVGRTQTAKEAAGQELADAQGEEDYYSQQLKNLDEAEKTQTSTETVTNSRGQQVVQPTARRLQYESERKRLQDAYEKAIKRRQTAERNSRKAQVPKTSSSDPLGLLR